MDDDLISLAEVARRVGYGATWVRKLADTDPAFPTRRLVSGYWLVSAAAAEAYFKARGEPKKGRPRTPGRHERGSSHRSTSA